MQWSLGTTYTRRPVPTPREPDPKAPQPPPWASRLVSWLGFEFSNVKRAVTQPPTRSVTANYAASVQDGVILADASGGAISVTLPTPAEAMNVALSIKRMNAGAAVTVVGTVDGTVNPTLGSQYAAMLVFSDGTQWVKLASV